MPMDPRKYPIEWRRISLATRDRAQGRCECQGECGNDHRGGRCEALNHQPHPETGSNVVLTTAHLCRCRDRFGRKCGEPSHLIAACQRCHLAIDRGDHIAHARTNRHARKAVADLFPEVR